MGIMPFNRNCTNDYEYFNANSTSLAIWKWQIIIISAITGYSAVHVYFSLGKDVIGTVGTFETTFSGWRSSAWRAYIEVADYYIMAAHRHRDLEDYSFSWLFWKIEAYY